MMELSRGTPVEVIREDAESRTSSVVETLDVPAIPGSPVYPERRAAKLVRLGDNSWYDAATGVEHPCASSRIRPLKQS